MSSSSKPSKVAALSSLFDGRGGRNDKPKIEVSSFKSRGGTSIFNNLRRTDSQVKRFSNAKEVFEIKDNLNSSNQCDLTTTDKLKVSSPRRQLSQTLPANHSNRFYSPGQQKSADIVQMLESRSRSNSTSSLRSVSSTGKLEVSRLRGNEGDKENMVSKFVRQTSRENIVGSSKDKKPVEQPVDKAADNKICETKNICTILTSPTSKEAEYKFSGLLEELLSPEYRKAEQEFEMLASNCTMDSTDAGLDVSAYEEETMVRSEDKTQVIAYEEEDIANTGSSEVVVVFPEQDGGNAVLKEGKLKTRQEESGSSSRLGTESLERLQSTPISSTPASSKLGQTFELSSDLLEKSGNKSEASGSEAGVNASSLGSSLVGQSVSSWLGRSTDCGLSSDQSAVSANPKCSPPCSEAGKVSPAPTESSDYVSGDSCELVSPPSSSPHIEQETAGLGEEEDEFPIHYLEDGHFWFDGPPVAAASRDDRCGGVGGSYRVPVRVRISTSPIRTFSTFSAEEYDRKNSEVDPAAATAEYEQEKRLERQERLELELAKGDAGLGITVLGVGLGGSGEPAAVQRLGIFIKTITANGAAARDGRLRVADQILSVDGASLVGVTQAQAAALLRTTGQTVQLVLGREQQLENSDVAALIRQSLEQELKAVDNVEMEGGAAADDTVSASPTASISSTEARKQFCLELNKEDTSVEEEGRNLSDLSQQGPHHHLPLDDGVARHGQAEEGAALQLTAVFQTSLDINLEDTTDKLSEFDISEILKKTEEYSGGVERNECSTNKFENRKEPSESTVLVKKTSSTVAENEPEAEAIETNTCCQYKKKFEILSMKYSEMETIIKQMGENLSLVTGQMMERDRQLVQHVQQVTKLLNHNQDNDGNVSAQFARIIFQPSDLINTKPVQMCHVII